MVSSVRVRRRGVRGVVANGDGLLKLYHRTASKVDIGEKKLKDVDNTCC